MKIAYSTVQIYVMYIGIVQKLQQRTLFGQKRIRDSVAILDRLTHVMIAHIFDLTHESLLTFTTASIPHVFTTPDCLFFLFFRSKQRNKIVHSIISII